MKTGLTQRGWNNVLIFASLFMIILFNSTHQRFVSNENSNVKRSLIEPSQFVQNIDFNGVKIERIGNAWRTVTQVPFKQQLDAENITQNWTQQLVTVLAQPPKVAHSQSRLPVAVDIIGATSGLIFEFIVEPELAVVYIFDHQNDQWMIIEQAQLSLFVPRFLFTVTS